MEGSVLGMDVPDSVKAALLLQCRRTADDIEASLARRRSSQEAYADAERPVPANSNDADRPPERHEADESAAYAPALTPGSSERILGAIFMAAGEGLLLVDEDFEIVRANQRAGEIYGVLEPNLMGVDIRSFTDASGAARLSDLFDGLIEGQRMSMELSCTYVDGSTFPATITATRIDLDGRRHWPLIVRDDTDRKSLENRLWEEKQQTEEMNVTLKNVLKNIEADRKVFETSISGKITTLLLPALKKIAKATEPSVRKSYLALFEEQLLSLIAGCESQPDPGLLRLSRSEINVCRMIQAGCSSKEICEALSLSFETVQTHRKNIRKKLELKGSKVNLHTFLANQAL